MSPKRIRRKRTKGWRMPEGAVYVGRPTKWGNPYRFTDYNPVWVDDDGETQHVPSDERKRWAVADFKSAVLYGIRPYPEIDLIRRELAGRDLACWCPIDQPCHADVLLEIANGEAP